MKIEELKDFEPSWKGMPAPPTPLNGAGSGVDSPSCDFVASADTPEIETSDLQEMPQTEVSDSFPSSDAAAHPWKCSFGDEGFLTVAGGTVYSNGGSSVVVEETTVTEGDVFLKITRDSTSRDVTAAEIVTPGGTDDADTQYIALASLVVDGDNKTITQLASREATIYEAMLVENGELKLVTFDASTRNSYALPTPPA